jgi:peptidyl-tRNA hydrolase
MFSVSYKYNYLYKSLNKRVWILFGKAYKNKSGQGIVAICKAYCTTGPS